MRLLYFVMAGLVPGAACQSADEASEPTSAAGGKADDASANKESLEDLRSASPELSDELKFPIDERLGAFALCSSTGDEFHAANAAWLGWFAFNEYAHFQAFAPAIVDLGFGAPGDELWGTCGRDLPWLVASYDALTEEVRTGKTNPDALPAIISDANIAELGGVCFRQFYQSVHGDLIKERKPVPSGLPGRFEQWLLQNLDSPDSLLSFVSAGEFTEKHEEFDFGSTQLVWAEHDELNLAVVSFRGTEPSHLSDLLIDLDFFPDRLEKNGWSEDWGKVHGGFLTGYQEVEAELDILLERADERGRELWITGHSLGGALGVVFGSRVLDRMQRRQLKNLTLGGIYTYGGPRVGNDDFVERLEREAERNDVQLVRVRHRADIVTGIPFSLGYEHAGRLAYVDENGLQVDADWDLLPKPSSVGDHATPPYSQLTLGAYSDNPSPTCR